MDPHRHGVLHNCCKGTRPSSRVRVVASVKPHTRGTAHTDNTSVADAAALHPTGMPARRAADGNHAV